MVLCTAHWIRCWPVMGWRASLLLEEDGSVPGISSSWAMAAEANKKIEQLTLRIIFAVLIENVRQMGFRSQRLSMLA
jgi:hypothetical protein